MRVTPKVQIIMQILLLTHCIWKCAICDLAICTLSVATAGSRINQFLVVERCFVLFHYISGFNSTNHVHTITVMFPAMLACTSKILSSSLFVMNSQKMINKRFDHKMTWLNHISHLELDYEWVCVCVCVWTLYTSVNLPIIASQKCSPIIVNAMWLWIINRYELLAREEGVLNSDSKKSGVSSKWIGETGPEAGRLSFPGV